MKVEEKVKVKKDVKEIVRTSCWYSFKTLRFEAKIYFIFLIPDINHLLGVKETKKA